MTVGRVSAKVEVTVVLLAAARVQDGEDAAVLAQPSYSLSHTAAAGAIGDLQ
jgi:hypothetical protein